MDMLSTLVTELKPEHRCLLTCPDCAWLAGLVATGPAGGVQGVAEVQGVPAGCVQPEGAPPALHQAALLHSFRYLNIHCGTLRIQTMITMPMIISIKVLKVGTVITAVFGNNNNNIGCEF